jgi:hypothetical protein
MSDRFSLRRLYELTSVCFAEPASARWIHPLAFGLPPFSKGALAYRYSQYVR